jgi:hypothetical protein
VGYTVGTAMGFWNLVMGALGPIVIFPNLAAIPTVPCEYLSCHPTGDQLWPPALRKARGLLLGSCTPGTMGHRLWPNKLDTTDSTSSQTTGAEYPMPGQPHHYRTGGRGMTIRTGSFGATSHTARDPGISQEPNNRPWQSVSKGSHRTDPT